MPAIYVVVMFSELKRSPVWVLESVIYQYLPHIICGYQLDASRLILI